MIIINNFFQYINVDPTKNVYRQKTNFYISVFNNSISLVFSILMFNPILPTDHSTT